MQPVLQARMPHRSPVHDRRYLRPGGRRSVRTGAIVDLNLDTRQKIITLDHARELAVEAHRSGAPPAAFVTHLEVLRAGVIERLQDLASASAPGNLFVIITDPESPLVPMDARAELAAALRVVDYVIPCADGAASALAAINPGFTFHDEEEDKVRTRELIEHVRSRSRI